MSDYSKYERKFDWNLSDLDHNKITIGEYEKQFKAIVDEIRADVINEYRDKVKEDVSTRLKGRKHYLADAEYAYEVVITGTFISALDFFAEQLKEQKNEL